MKKAKDTQRKGTIMSKGKRPKSNEAHQNGARLLNVFWTQSI